MPKEKPPSKGSVIKLKSCNEEVDTSSVMEGIYTSLTKLDLPVMSIVGLLEILKLHLIESATQEEGDD